MFEQSDAAKDIIEESLQDTKCRKRRQKGGKGLILLSTVSSLLWKLLHAVHVIYRNMYQRRKSVWIRQTGNSIKTCSACRAASVQRGITRRGYQAQYKPQNQKTTWSRARACSLLHTLVSVTVSIGAHSEMSSNKQTSSWILSPFSYMISVDFSLWHWKRTRFRDQRWVFLAFPFPPTEPSGSYFH